MKITVETGKWASRYLKDEIVSIDMPEQSTVADVIKTLGLPPDETGIVTTAGMTVPREYLLSDGEVLKIYTVIIGG